MSSDERLFSWHGACVEPMIFMRLVVTGPNLCLENVQHQFEQLNLVSQFLVSSICLSFE